MVDCGEGTQRQLLRSGAGFRRLDRLLLTHAHFDHVLGIPGLFSTLRLRQSADVMTIHGSPTTLDVVVRMLAGLWGEGRAPIPLQLVPLAEGRILDAGEFTIDGFPVRHRDTESFAFSFESQVRRALGFSSEGGIFSGGIYVAVEGTAELIRDKAAFQQHWTSDLDNWFENGVNTPGIVLIMVKAKRATYWKGREEGEVEL
jgi:phosphoribosyl 1,2-cyclic phosphodiesterase